MCRTSLLEDVAHRTLDAATLPPTAWQRASDIRTLDFKQTAIFCKGYVSQLVYNVVQNRRYTALTDELTNHLNGIVSLFVGRTSERQRTTLSRQIRLLTAFLQKL